MKLITILSILSVFMLSFFAVGCQPGIQNKDVITVAGHADLDIAPDLAKVYVGISILKPTAAEAQKNADTVINAIIDGLRYKGITESDIETENVNLYQDQEWVEQDSRMRTIGWRATQTLKITTNDLTKVGDIVDVAIHNGANQINSIEFYLSDSKDDEAKKLALAKATQNAQVKAQTIAENLGVSLGRITSASESNYGYVPYQYALHNTIGAAAIEESATVMPRDVTASADITLIYTIRQ